MQVPLQITLRNLTPSSALTERIRGKVAKLEALGRHIIGCSVTLDAPHRHGDKARHYSVRLDLRVPGREIVVTREHHEDVYIALRDAFDVAARETEAQTRIVRGEVKPRAASARVTR